MSRQHPRWLCPTLNMLVINNFANVYGKNEWGFSLPEPREDGGGASTILLYSRCQGCVFLDAREKRAWTHPCLAHCCRFFPRAFFALQR